MDDNMETLNLDNEVSIIDLYGDDLTEKEYVTNPAIARDEEIKKLILVLLTPDKSGLLIGKPGIGKTAIVEGLAYRIQHHQIPNVLGGYHIIKMPSTSLIGTISDGTKDRFVIELLVQELKKKSKIILFIDEIHTLMGGNGGSPMDLANMLKPALDRGDIKVIGATTTDEYNTYVIRDRAFLRRFERIDILEPSEATTVDILFGSLPRMEKQTGIRMKYNDYVNRLLLESIVKATSEFKRVYGLSAMYPDIAFSVLSGAFSNALFDNKKAVDVLDVYNAIRTSKRIYPDSIVKELSAFREKFKDFCTEEGIELPIVTINDIEPLYEIS